MAVFCNFFAWDLMFLLFGMSNAVKKLRFFKIYKNYYFQGPAYAFLHKKSKKKNRKQKKQKKIYVFVKNQKVKKILLKHILNFLYSKKKVSNFKNRVFGKFMHFFLKA